MSAEDIGASKIVANLNAQLAQIKNATPAGMLAAGFIIQRDSQERVPIEYEFLRASAYTRKAPDDAMVVEVGYSAVYAAKVHEDVEMKLAGKVRKSGIGVYWGPKGEAQFLLKAVRDKTDTVLTTVAKYAEIRK